MNAIVELWKKLAERLDGAGAWIGLLPIRLLMSYEFLFAGYQKLGSSNWFGKFQDNFLFPFNVIPVEVSWVLATSTEIIGGYCILVGLFTRFWAFSLIIVSVVAISGVHWPEHWSSLAELWKGYAVTNKGFGNYRIPLLFIAMLVPLVFLGSGKLSLDHLIARRLDR